MKYLIITTVLFGCLVGTAFAADPIANPDQYDRTGYLAQGQETSATCGAKDLQACHGNCISKNQICLNVPIAGHNTFASFQEYFQVIYSFILGGVAILATVMVMWGGFRWLVSRGNSGEIGEAKKIIWSAVIGLVLAFLSFTILYLVNPKLTVIGLPQLKTANLTVQATKLTFQNNQLTSSDPNSVINNPTAFKPDTEIDARASFLTILPSDPNTSIHFDIGLNDLLQPAELAQLTDQSADFYQQNSISFSGDNVMMGFNNVKFTPDTENGLNVTWDNMTEENARVFRQSLPVLFHQYNLSFIPADDDSGTHVHVIPISDK